jgi:hypothetical protein
MGKFQKDKTDAVKVDGGVQKAAAPAKKTRDFSADLQSYLTQWKNDKESWKFNKVLQTWALIECLDGERISKNLFHDLIPYLCSIQGGARDRLLERCETIVSAHDEQTEATTEVKRSRKIIVKLRKAMGLDEPAEKEEA